MKRAKIRNEVERVQFHYHCVVNRKSIFVGYTIAVLLSQSELNAMYTALVHLGYNHTSFMQTVSSREYKKKLVSFIFKINCLLYSESNAVYLCSHFQMPFSDTHRCVNSIIFVNRQEICQRAFNNILYLVNLCRQRLAERALYVYSFPRGRSRRKMRI